MSDEIKIADSPQTVEQGTGAQGGPDATAETRKPVELTDDALASVSGGSGVTRLSDMAKTQHELSQDVVRNIRG
jgi:hypothetical protein